MSATNLRTLLSYLCNYKRIQLLLFKRRRVHHRRQAIPEPLSNYFTSRGMIYKTITQLRRVPSKAAEAACRNLKNYYLLKKSAKKAQSFTGLHSLILHLQMLFQSRFDFCQFSVIHHVIPDAVNCFSVTVFYD